MKRVNYDGGQIYYQDAVVDMEDNKANYLLPKGDVIASAAGLSTAAPVPARIDNRPGARVSRAQELLKNGASGLALSANDNTFFTRNGAIELLKTLEEAFGNVRTSPATRRDPDTGLLSWGPHNYAPWSQDFDNAAWTKTGGGTGSTTVVTPNAVIAPDGTLTADKLDFNLNGGTTANDQSHISFNTAPLNLIGLLATNSVWLRADVPVTVALRTPANNGTYILCNVTTEWKRFYTSVLMTQAGIVYQIGLRGTFTTANTASVYAWGASVILGDLQNYVPNFTSSPTFRLRRHLSPKLNRIVTLVEETRTNLMLRSNEFDNSAWTKTNGAVTANNQIGPDGLLSADIFTTGSLGTAGLAQTFTGTAVAYTYSCFFKAISGGNWVRITGTNSGSPTNNSAWFNLSTGVIGTVGPNIVSAAIESWGNGWYRCAITIVCGAVTETFYIRGAGADNDSTSPAGNVIAMFNGQVELGSCMSSPIFTVAASVQRTADAPSIPISSLPYNPLEGTIYAEAAKYWPSVNTVINIAGFFNSNLLERLYYYNINRGWNVRNVTDQCDMPIGSTNVGTLYKMAGSYKLNDFDFASGGVLHATPDNSGTVGDATGGNFTLGGLVTEITEVAAYTTKLPDGNLQALTV